MHGGGEAEGPSDVHSLGPALGGEPHGMDQKWRGWNLSQEDLRSHVSSWGLSLLVLKTGLAWELGSMLHAIPAASMFCIMQ